MPSTTAPQHATDPATTGLEPAGDGRMWCDGRYRASLERIGLTGFEAVMRSSAGRCLRVLADRENWYLTLPQPDQQARGAFLKRHHVRTLQSWLRAKLGIAPGESAGRVEARNVGALAARGIEVMHLVAYGERLHGDGRWESFLLTEELAGYSELGHFLKRRFAAPAAQHRTGRDRDLRRLIDEVADIVGRLHAAGFNHRDLYCCHFLIKEPAPGQFDIRLIDLQRVQHRRRFRRRWVVKDLAQLAWSAPHECITCTRRMAFIRRYLGVRRLRAADKRLIREVLAKQQLMQRRLGVEA